MSDDSIGEQLRAMCVDYDGSQMPDEAGPFNVRCGHLRSAADYIQRLEAERDEAQAERENFCELLHDLVMIDAEEWATGGGPGFKDRREKAWSRARERFEP